MRHGSSNRRVRNRNGRKPSVNKNRAYDSSGPDVRIRGTAFQIAEKYEALSKDAAASGDLILAESYIQHAEHYLRIINSWAQEQAQASEANSYNEKAQQPSSTITEDQNVKQSAPKKELETA